MIVAHALIIVIVLALKIITAHALTITLVCTMIRIIEADAYKFSFY